MSSKALIRPLQMGYFSWRLQLRFFHCLAHVINWWINRADWWVPTGSPLLRLFMLISGLFYSAETPIITYHLWSLKNSKYLTLSEKLLVCYFILCIHWLLSVCVLVAVVFVTTVCVMLWLNSVCVCDLQALWTFSLGPMNSAICLFSPVSLPFREDL